MPKKDTAEDLIKRSKRRRLEDELFEEFELFKLPLPERQFRFHPTRKWTVDFAWPALKIMVEVQGGLYIGGGHNRGGYMEKEYEKNNQATLLGWAVYKFGPKSCHRPKHGSDSSEALAFLYPLLKKSKVADVTMGAGSLTKTLSLEEIQAIKRQYE